MKIMTNIKTLAALLMAGAAFTACSSSDENIIETQQPANPTGKYTMTVKASKGDAAATRALGISGNTLNATWADGEKVKVYEGENLLGELSATNSNGTECTLTGDLTALPSASGVTLTLKFNAATLGGQNGTLNYIASHNDYATATTEVSAIDANTITGSDASFTNQNAIAKITVKNNNSVLANPSQITVSVTTTNAGVLALLAQLGKSLPSYTFDVTDAYTTNGGDFLYFALPTLSVIATEMGLNETQAAAIAAAPGDINLDLTATVGSDTYTYTKTGYPFTQSKYYVITVNMTKPSPFASVTAADLGKIIGNDSKIYADKSAAEAAGATAVAMIAYVGNDAETSQTNTAFKNGLALALEDVSGTKAWCSQEDATCLGTQYTDKFNDLAGIDNTDALVNHTGHTHAAANAARGYNSGTHPAGTSAWFLPSAGQWSKMATAASGYANLKTNAGLQAGAKYWSSTESHEYDAWRFNSNNGAWGGAAKDVDGPLVRACLAF